MKLKITILIILFSTIYIKNISIEPYDSIKLIPFNSIHYFQHHVPLKKIILDKKKEKNDIIIVELGSFLGGSTRFMANLLDNTSKLYAIDHWLGNINWEKKEETKDIYSHMFHLFLSNIIHSKLTNKIIPIRMETIEAAKALKIKPDIIYIDASHDEASVYNDIMAWWPKLKIGGIMCGDDYSSAWGVKAAVDKCAKILGKKVLITKSFWEFSRK